MQITKPQNRTENVAKVEVRKSKIQGKGVFTSADIQKGEAICILRGSRITIAQLKAQYASGEERIDDPLQVSDDEYINLEEPYVFFNHSCTPNAGMRGTLMFALREIKTGEELTFDYSTTEWSDGSKWGKNWTNDWRIPCHCGSPNCRGEIREFPLLPDKMKREYLQANALPDFILRRFLSQHTQIRKEPV
jgi:SET domain-containing protein